MLNADSARALYRYDPETGILYRRHALCEKVGKAKSNGYLVVSVDGKNYQAHRVAWLIVTGKWPTGDIDHINGIKTDNRWHNLRDVSHQVNTRNRVQPSGERAKLIGPVPIKGGGWMVVFPHYEGFRELGPFVTHAEAHDVFAKAINTALKHEGKPEPRLRSI